MRIARKLFDLYPTTLANNCNALLRNNNAGSTGCQKSVFDIYAANAAASSFASAVVQTVDDDDDFCGVVVVLDY